MELKQENLPQHIAIIMDGNRRWAKAKGVSTKEGHKAGADNLEKITLICNRIGIKYLTVYAFSTENWKRSEEEVSALMIIMKTYIDSFTKRANKDNIVVKVLGDITILSAGLQKSLNNIIKTTKNNTGLTLNIAFNYGGRQELVMATKKIAEQVKMGTLNIENITEETVSQNLYTAGIPDPDLMIRTSKEFRTSNFLPWQLVYTEFYFPDIHWPEFNEDELMKAIEVYQSRNRRFGGRPDESQTKVG